MGHRLDGFPQKSDLASKVTIDFGDLLHVCDFSPHNPTIILSNTELVWLGIEGLIDVGLNLTGMNGICQVLRRVTWPLRWTLS